MVQTPDSKRDETNQDAETPPKQAKEACVTQRPGFGGRVRKAMFCKNKACACPRTPYFRNALCPECEVGLRVPGRSRKASDWTHDMCVAVARESEVKRQKQALNKMSPSERILHEQQLEILAELRKNRSG